MPKLKPLSSVQSCALKWAWPYKIPRGQCTIIEGEPDTNKSTLLARVAANVTRGTSWPDGTPCPTGPVIVISAEDLPESIMKPRYQVAGADMDHVHIVFEDPDEPDFVIPDGAKWLREQAEIYKPKMIIIDPVSAFFAPNVKQISDSSVRHALRPIERIAKDFDLAVVIVRHLNKNEGASAMNRGSGSIGIGAGARSVQLLVRDPADPDGRIMAPVKGNWAKDSDKTSVRLRVESCDTTTDDGEAINVGRIKIGDKCDLTAAELLMDAETRKQLTTAIHFLRTKLANGEEVPTKKLHSAAHDEEISRRSLRSAAQLLGVRFRRVGFGEGSEVYASLPTTAEVIELNKWNDSRRRK